MLVRDLPPGERPLERLDRLGPQALKDSELLAIILGGQTALRAADTVLVDGLEKLANRIHGRALSPTRKARVLALLELSRRLQALRSKPGRDIWQSWDIGPHLVAKYSHEPQERVGVVLLDSRNRIKSERIVFIGQHDQINVRPRWLIKYAIIDDAAAMIVFHNHPSGDPTPSSDDGAFTEKMKKLCDSLDVKLFDHSIIGHHRYYSYREHGQL